MKKFTYLYLLLTFVSSLVFAQVPQNILTIGPKTNVNKAIKFNRNSATPPQIRWNESLSRLEFSGDGSTFNPFTSGTILNYRSVTGTDTALTTDDVLVLSGSSFTETLFTAVGNSGKAVDIIHLGTSLTNQYTIATIGGQTIGGASTLIMYGNTEYLRVISDGANWKIVAHSIPTLTVSSSQSIVVPIDKTSAMITIIGGGGGGGTSVAFSSAGGGGGGGGAGAQPVTVTKKVSGTLVATVGAGGASGTAPTHNQVGNAGLTGGDSTLTGTGLDLIATGAVGGSGGTLASSGASAGGTGYGTSITGYPVTSDGGASGATFSTAGSSGAKTFIVNTGAAGGTSGGTNTNSGRGGGGGGSGLGIGGAGGNGGVNGVTGLVGNAPASDSYGAGGGGGGAWGATGVGSGLVGGTGQGGAVLITFK